MSRCKGIQQHMSTCTQCYLGQCTLALIGKILTIHKTLQYCTIGQLNGLLAQTFVVFDGTQQQLNSWFVSFNIVEHTRYHTRQTSEMVIPDLAQVSTEYLDTTGCCNHIHQVGTCLDKHILVLLKHAGVDQGIEGALGSFACIPCFFI